MRNFCLHNQCLKKVLRLLVIFYSFKDQVGISKTESKYILWNNVIKTSGLLSSYDYILELVFNHEADK